MLGHVNHARVLSLTEDARVAMMPDRSGADAPQHGIILARLEVDYLRQLYYRTGETLVVESWVSAVGTSSVRLHQEIAQDGETALRALAVLVSFDFTAQTSSPHTESDRARWEQFRDE
jgi:acyl-CoA thioester hydrolase